MRRLSSITTFKSWLKFIIFIFLFPTSHLHSYQTTQYKKALEKKNKELILKKKEIKKLKEQEKKIYANILKIESNIKQINLEINKKKEELNNLESKEKLLQAQINKLKKHISQKKEYLNQVLKLLWEAYLQKSFLSNLENFRSIYLKYYWLKAIYEEYNQELKEIEVNQRELSEKILKLDSLKLQIKSKIDNIEEKKDDLLRNKMALFSNLQKVRALSMIKEKQLEEIIDTVEKIKYNLKILKTRQFSRAKGYLFWPVKSKKTILKRKGIVIYAKKGDKVSASFWGKVVYDGKLRGFGDVVILYHGKGYYTLYAYLSKANVKIGQMVEPKEPIGEVGFCPAIKGYGLYFEIRKGKKALNPKTWLSS